MASKSAEAATWNSALGTALVVAALAGWGIAGAAYLSGAPLLVGALVGIACGLTGVALWRAGR